MEHSYRQIGNSKQGSLDQETVWWPWPSFAPQRPLVRLSRRCTLRLILVSHYSLQIAFLSQYSRFLFDTNYLHFKLFFLAFFIYLSWISLWANAWRVPREKLFLAFCNVPRLHFQGSMWHLPLDGPDAGFIAPSKNDQRGNTSFLLARLLIKDFDTVIKCSLKSLFRLDYSISFVDLKFHFQSMFSTECNESIFFLMYACSQPCWTLRAYFYLIFELILIMWKKSMQIFKIILLKQLG